MSIDSDNIESNKNTNSLNSFKKFFHFKELYHHFLTSHSNVNFLCSKLDFLTSNNQSRFLNIYVFHFFLGFLNIPSFFYDNLKFKICLLGGLFCKYLKVNFKTQIKE